MDILKWFCRRPRTSKELAPGFQWFVPEHNAPHWQFVDGADVEGRYGAASCMKLPMGAGVAPASDPKLRRPDVIIATFPETRPSSIGLIIDLLKQDYPDRILIIEGSPEGGVRIFATDH